RNVAEELSDREHATLDYLRANGASFFAPLHDAVGGGYPAQTVDALWNLVWAGLVTNDTVHALRVFTRARAARRKNPRVRPAATPFRSRRLAPPSAEGRWSLVAHPRSPKSFGRVATDAVQGGSTRRCVEEIARWSAKASAERDHEVGRGDHAAAPRPLRRA